MKHFRNFARRATLSKLRTDLDVKVLSRANERVGELNSNGATVGETLSELHKIVSPAADEIAELDRLILAKTTDREIATKISALPTGLERKMLELELARRRIARRPVKDFMINLTVVLGLSSLGIMFVVLYIKYVQP